MNIAVLADIHGRLPLAFTVVARLEEETGEMVDAIVQCGDVGVFPRPETADKATRRHAERDSSELGFSRYFLRPVAGVEAVLDRLGCSMYCVRGNHEDHAFLDHLEASSDGPFFPVDCYRRVLVMRSGVPYRLPGAPAGVAPLVMGIGRVGPPRGETEPGRPKYIQPEESERVLELVPERLDLLVSHDAARDALVPGLGLDEVRLVLDQVRPAYHFFGHVGRPVPPHLDANGVTTVAKVADLSWQDGRLRDGCLGLLRWHGPGHHSFEVVTAPWLREYTPHAGHDASSHG